MTEALGDGDVCVAKTTPEVTLPGEGTGSEPLVHPGGGIERILRALTRRSTGPDGRVRPRPVGTIERSQVAAAFVSLLQRDSAPLVAVPGLLALREATEAEEKIAKWVRDRAPRLSPAIRHQWECQATP